MKKIIQIFICCILSGSAFGQTKEITVNVSGFKSDKGRCLISLFNSPKGFPTKSDKAIKSFNCKISGGKCSILVKDLAPGMYAIAAIHDENENRKMDTNFMGIPKEGAGVSNNPKGSDGPPDFDDAKFQLKNGSQVFAIHIAYL